MKKILLSAIIAFLAIGLYAQDTAQVEPKVKLELVWKKEFEYPGADFIIDINEEGEPKIKVIAFIKEQGKESLIRFMDKKGKLLRETRGNAEYYGSRVLISKDGEYIGISSVAKGDPEFIYEVDFDVYDKDGNYVWGQKGMNVRPFRLLSDATILSYEGFGWQKFTLHNKNGLIDSISPIQAEGTGACDISKNNYIVFNVHDVNRNEGYVVLYNGIGKEIWHKKFDWRHTSKVVISDYGEYIAAIGKSSEGRMLSIISHKGDLLWQFHSGNCYYMDFSPESKYFVAGINLNEICLFESATGRILWKYKLSDKRSFFSIAVSNNGEFVTAADGGGRRELPSGDTSTIYLFDKKGNIVWQKDLKIQKERAPHVRFTDDGKYLIICNSNKLYCYKIAGGGQ